MAYASITYTSASGTTFALTNSSGDPIEYLRQNDISVTVNGVLKTLTTDYTFNTAGTAIVLNTAVSGATVVIARTTDIADATVSFTAGSTLTAQDLNNSDKQNRFALQEFSDTYGALTTGTGDLSALAGFIGSAETWVSDNAHAPTTGAVDNRIDSKITTNNATVVLRNGSQAMQAALSLGGFKITNLATPTSDTDASTKAYVDSTIGTASGYASAAAASASAAATSATNAASSASSASTSASNASTSASNAASSASSASSSASSASTSASNAASSATSAATSATSAASSAASALAAFDSFDDRYLGAKASDPTVDNDGDPLNAGDLYYNTTSSVMKVYTGTVWVTAYVPGDAASISFTPYSTIAATNVQNAVQELTDEKLNLTGGTLTGAFGVTAGTAAAPSVFISGDTNTGIYSPGADQVAISTNGTGRLFVASNGNVGVGRSTSINERLSVQDTSLTSTTVGANIVAGFRSNAANADVSIALTDGVSSSAQFGQIAGSLYWYTNGSERMRLDTSGRLGVGVSAPGAVLHAASTGAGIQEVQWLRNGQSVAADVGSALVFTGTTNDNGLARISGAFAGAATTDGAYMAFSTRAVTTGTLTERLRITAGGSVGIGTSSPAAQLDCRGDARFGALSRFAITESGGDPTIGGTSGSNFLGFTVNGTTKATLTSTGLGIGTTTVNRPLVVFNDSVAALSLNNTTTGTAGGDGFQIQLVGSDGYVFNYEAAPVIFGTAATERARIDSSGRLLVGTSSARTNFFGNGGFVPAIQVDSAGSPGNQYISIIGNSASSGYAGGLVLAKTRGATVGSITAVQNNDELGILSFQGTDGTNPIPAAAIQAYVDATPGANDMPGRLVFSTTLDGSSSPTERMRISNNGTVYFGPGSGSTLNSAAFIPDGNLSPYLLFNTNYGGGTKTNLEFQRNGTTAGSITSTSTTTAYNTSSDYRLKENITLVTDGITRLQQLKPSRFNFKVDPTNTVDGFIAHEVQAVVPEAITGEKDAVDAEGVPIYQGIDQSKLVPLLTAALQEAIGEIESLKARLTAAGI